MPQDIIDFSKDREELWVDYVADTGDGFDATASVASLLVDERLPIPPFAPGGASHTTVAGPLLVLGGDEVYPYASQDEYRNRFIAPFRGVFPHAEPQRTLVALPGNHDWYDGLTAFLQVFCGRRSIGGWKNGQRRSYFACKLPQRWWLWAIDIQLDTYIDEPQLEYFRMAANQVKKGDGIVLCWAVPSWVEHGGEKSSSYKILDYFQRNIVPDHAHLRVSLTGDSHHYARYKGPKGEQKITAGLGGAFLSATHHLPGVLDLPSGIKGEGPIRFDNECIYPPRAESKELRKGVLTSIYANDGFPALMAVAYGLLALAFTRGNPMPVVAAVALVATICVGFAKAPKPVEWGPGLAHAAVHLATAATVIGGIQRVSRDWSAPARFVTTAVGAVSIGAAVGPLIFALYLLAADGLGRWRRNTNELFAAQAIEDHKGFLRLHFRPDGGLTIYPIKIEKIARWTENGTWPDSQGGGPRLVSDGPLHPELIEEVIHVSRVPE